MAQRKEPFVAEKAHATAIVDVSFTYDVPATETRPTRAEINISDIELRQDERTRLWAASSKDHQVWALQAETPEDAVGRIILAILAGRAITRAEAPTSPL